jgi:Phospholipid methyltransferase
MSEMEWMTGWQRVARRIRVPLGFVAAALYLVSLYRQRPELKWMLASVPFVAAGVLMRSYAAGYVKKNRELTRTGPYAHTRNPLYLGSILIAAGFALALENVWFTLVLVVFFVVIYVPVIASEERFLRATFSGFDDYCRQVPRLIPRLTAAPAPEGEAGESGRFSMELYRRHREYNSAIGALLLYGSLCLAYLLHGL